MGTLWAHTGTVGCIVLKYVRTGRRNVPSNTALALTALNGRFQLHVRVNSSKRTPPRTNRKFLNSPNVCEHLIR